MRPSGTLEGAAFLGAKIWNSEKNSDICRLWRIGVCVADSDILKPLTTPNTPAVLGPCP